ncbi:hypothetical protein FJTKL_00918 [Diaporthe vaccinii]|uniref:Uncharacterized protein n=1 Tax=Diaporthe vaccinii TaxID=105482 RepID=A0ABR4E1W9_9PEZI
MAQCFCHKLLNKQYDQLSESEVEILEEALRQLPFSQPPDPPTQPAGITLDPRRPKRKGFATRNTETRRATKLPRLQDTTSGPLRTSCLPDRQSNTTSCSQLPERARLLLVKCSYDQDVDRLSLGIKLNNNIAAGTDQLTTATRIFNAIEEIEKKVDNQLRMQRILCYALARLHTITTSLDPIRLITQDAGGNPKHTKKRLSHWIHIGRRWAKILQWFASSAGKTLDQVTGIFYTLESISFWEREPQAIVQAALEELSHNTILVSQVEKLSQRIKQLLAPIPSMQYYFCDETPNFISNGVLLDMTQSSSRARGLLEARTISEPGAVRASLETSGGSSTFTPAGDAEILARLVSFLSPVQKLTHDFLTRGGSRRRRWAVNGSTEETDALSAGLTPELAHLLSDHDRLSRALDQLSGSILETLDQGYVLNEDTAGRIRQDLSPEESLFWKCQALITTYRAIPWKYIEPGNIDVSTILPHLQYTATTYEDCFQKLNPSTLADLALTLLEAARFPSISWKRLAANQAKVALSGSRDWHLSTCLARVQSVLYRLDGKQEEAVQVLHLSRDQEWMIEKNEKTNAATGHLAIQRTLNHIQVEELTQAEACLDKWVPLDHYKPSRIEQVVQFRRSVILGRLMRYQGRFVESDAHLKTAYGMVKQIKDLHFDEDRRDLICEIADTSRELKDLEPAETHLRAELSRWGQHSQGPAFSGKSLLDACLAEILFAREKYEEAKTLCDEVRVRRNLLKFAKLRIFVVLAKICHVRDDYGGAMGHWSEALQAIAGFELTNGRTTRMIVSSQENALGKLGHAEIRDQSRKQVVVLDELAKPGGTLYWIAGMRHWQQYLESGVTRSRI